MGNDKKKLYSLMADHGKTFVRSDYMTKEEARLANCALPTWGGSYWTPSKPARPVKHGGSRPGAGRKPKYSSPMLHASIRLPAEWQADLRAEFGSLQKAIEALVLAHREGKAQP